MLFLVDILGNASRLRRFGVIAHKLVLLSSAALMSFISEGRGEINPGRPFSCICPDLCPFTPSYCPYSVSAVGAGFYRDWHESSTIPLGFGNS